jgi:hypothetical protein
LDRQERAAIEPDERRLVEPARNVQHEHVAMFAIGQHVAVEGAADDGDAVGDASRSGDGEWTGSSSLDFD